MTPSTRQFLYTCHLCRKLDRSMAKSQPGHPVCLINGVYFAENAEKGKCPDVIDQFAHPPEEIDPLWSATPDAVKGQGCCDGSSA